MTQISQARRSTPQTLERLEQRALLSFVAHVNFQPAKSTVPSGYFADSGAAYGGRNGLTYGWNTKNAYVYARNSSLSADARYDTLAMMQNGGTYTWQIAVPSGLYQVHVVAGDASSYSGLSYQINVEGTLAISGTPTSASRWVEGTVVVNVADGKLTISNASGAKGNRIDYVDISTYTPLPTSTSVGINLYGNLDWDTSHFWADAGHAFRQWGMVGQPWNADPKMTFTADDYPLQDADALSYLNDYPTGTYKLTYQYNYADATGKLLPHGDMVVGLMAKSMTNVVRTVDTTNNVVTVSADVYVQHDNPDGTGGIMTMGIRNNVATNPVHSIHLWSPGTGPGSEFNADFLRRAVPFGDVRFMDWIGTNNSTQVNWSDRPLTSSVIQTQKGVAWEYIIDLANQLHRDVWINVPAMATDDYVTQLATLFRDKLDPTLKIRFEYSNEVWNSIFQQFGYNLNQAKANALLTATDDFGRCAQQYAYRSMQISNIFKTVFATQASRLIPVFGGQNSNTYWAGTGLGFIQAKYGAPSQYFSEVAIAPYVGDSLPAAPKGGWTLDTLFPALENFNSTTLSGWIHDAKTVATSNGLGLSAYEAGQALSGNTSISSSLATAAQADPRMYKLYHDMVATWKLNGGGLYNEFSSIGPGWGLLSDIRLAGSREWDAVMDVTLTKGDVNLDGKVDYNDFLILKANYGKSGMWWEQGDLNGDNVIDKTDFNLLYANLTGLTAAQQADVDAFKTSIGA